MVQLTRPEVCCVVLVSFLNIVTENYDLKKKNRKEEICGLNTCGLNN